MDCTDLQESEHSKYLQALGLFKSYIIQIRTVDAMESVGYNRAGKGSDARRIATVAVGYADGLDRRLGNGKWALSWQGKTVQHCGRCLYGYVHDRCDRLRRARGG